MEDNFVDKYNEEVSESSIIDGEELKQNLLQTTEPAKNNPPSIPRHQNNAEIAPYTFDPKSVLKSTESNSREVKYEIYNPSEPAHSSSRDFSYVKIPSKNPYTARVSDIQKDITMIGDLNECRRTDEYKGFAQEFDKEYSGDQKEKEQVSKDLVTRTKKLEEFRRELENADLDMILFRNRLVRELDDVQNDMKEAYSHIVVLMDDRSNMKDQFCLFKMKIKKLKGFIKTFQDDIQGYFFI